MGADAYLIHPQCTLAEMRPSSRVWPDRRQWSEMRPRSHPTSAAIVDYAARPQLQDENGIRIIVTNCPNCGYHFAEECFESEMEYED